MTFDLAIIGGGINGAAIARDAAGRGLRVVLVEQHDLASHTSSASTKLIHGGLRYLEHYEFGLVRKALAERERLLRSAPHIMWPLRFVIPHAAGMRPAWLIRCGLFLYDHLARRDSLPGSRAITLAGHPAGAALQPYFTRGFEYSDGWVDDARFVLLNALDAAQHGATVMTRTACLGARRGEEDWVLTLQADGEAHSHELRARALVNATGPWAERFLSSVGQRAHHRLRLVRGSHIVVPRLFAHDYAYLFQAPDRRIVFALPYEHDFTLIGTTEVEHLAGTDTVHASEDEIAYLCEQASRSFRHTITPQDVRWHFAGLRPLLDDDNQEASSVTRDYLLELDSVGPPILSVFGGKLTTCRKLAEEAMNSLQGPLGFDRGAWTSDARLPGADWPTADFASFLSGLRSAHPAMPARLLQRMAHAYGSRVVRILGPADARPAMLGDEVLPGLYEAELAYLCREEWARTAEDILWRRSKLGLHLPADAALQLAQWLQARASLPRT